MDCPFSKKPCDKIKTVHIKQIINGEASELHYCNECEGLPPPFPGFMALPLIVMPFLQSNFLATNLQKLEMMEDAIESPIQCSECGSSIIDIQRSGRFGCAHCYEVFTDQIRSILPHYHAGKRNHIGKKPKIIDVEYLKKEMQNAVLEERYEDAAKIRDQVKSLEQTLQSNNVESPNISI